MILYHGSNCAIDRIDLSKCMPYKDFGRGFYLTTLLDQARNMARRTTAIRETGTPVVTAFELADGWRESGLRVLEFDGATREWATFIVNNRNREFTDVLSPLCNRSNQYDVVIGPVADDRIVASFHLFLDGFITIDELVARLEYRELNNQYSFHTPAAIGLLECRGVAK